MTVDDPRDTIRETMETEGVAQPAIVAFLDAVERVRQGDTGMISESDIDPVDSVTRFDDLPEPRAADHDLLQQLCVIKLNGGLGTGMGLAGPKSLLKVRGDDTFLDFIARQMLRLREKSASDRPAFLLMNSFNTRAESLDYLTRYADLAAGRPLDFVQNKVPKLDPDSLLPVEWPADPALAWCPPGHGDLYPSLLGNDNLLQRLLDDGFRYLFVSNADNLGATVDVRILRHFADSGQSFLMEVAQRTDSDRKGGHLARRSSSGRLLLRESAQCLPDDVPSFQDIEKHQFFNTNNLWIRLEAIGDALEAGRGTISLPLIQNRKTVDPQDPTTPPVLQLESAMGAAIECFDQTGALLVPRSRFAPVKTTNDLLAVRSDAYVSTEENSVLRLADARAGVPPRIELDKQHYKMIDDFECHFPEGPPSLIRCTSLQVEGSVRFEPSATFTGDVSIVNPSAESRTLTERSYADATVEL